MKRLTMTFYLLLGSQLAIAADAVYTPFFSDLAVGGYDPVAYFQEHRAVKGNKQFKLKYQGATWRFSSLENQRRFAAAPEKYAPQYGGYCAWAIGHGDTAKGDPRFWTIDNGRLYLNYDQNIQNQWLKNKPHWIQQADQNWPEIID